MAESWQRPSGNNVPTHADFWKSEFQNGRVPEGQDAGNVDNLSADPGYGKLRPRGSSGHSDPLGQTAGKGVTSNDGKVGATYRIEARLPAQATPKSYTQANGRILPPTHSRSGSFYAQGVWDDTAK